MAHNLDSKERTGDIKLNENIDFSQMLFSDKILGGLKIAGFKYPSPIQLAAIPLGRCGLDLIIQAKSGTGKTLVFTIIALEMINTNITATQVLILAPTREIAFQIGTVIKSVSSKLPKLRVNTFIGGTCLERDKANLKTCHIAIGTAGRVKRLIELKVLKTYNIKLFVLDEADQLLGSQFMEAIVQIYKLLPSNKQVLALSATYSDEEISFIKKLTISPSFVMLDKESPSLIGIRQFVYSVPFSYQLAIRHQKKVDVLFKIISYLKFNQCIIFSDSQFRAESLCHKLIENNWSASYMSGAQQQNERLKSFQALCSHKCRIMVSTDLSARGLDSEHVNLVINLDIPSNQATYLHRIGRAGRYGSLGYAITFACEGAETESFRNIVTELNLNVKMLPCDFKKFENLQIRSSDDYSQLDSFSKKIVESNQLSETLPDNSTHTNCLLANKVVNKYVYTKINGITSDGMPFKSKYTSNLSLNGISVMPAMNKKVFKPISISYDEILKQIVCVDDTLSNKSSTPFYKSFVECLPAEDGCNTWKTILDSCKIITTCDTNEPGDGNHILNNMGGSVELLEIMKKDHISSIDEYEKVDDTVINQNLVDASLSDNNIEKDFISFEDLEKVSIRHSSKMQNGSVELLKMTQEDNISSIDKNEKVDAPVIDQNLADALLSDKKIEKDFTSFEDIEKVSIRHSSKMQNGSAELLKMMQKDQISSIDKKVNDTDQNLANASLSDNKIEKQFISFKDIEKLSIMHYSKKQNKNLDEIIFDPTLADFSLDEKANISFGGINLQNILQTGENSPINQDKSIIDPNLLKLSFNNGKSKENSSLTPLGAIEIEDLLQKNEDSPISPCKLTKETSISSNLANVSFNNKEAKENSIPFVDVEELTISNSEYSPIIKNKHREAAVDHNLADVSFDNKETKENLIISPCGSKEHLIISPCGSKENLSVFQKIEISPIIQYKHEDTTFDHNLDDVSFNKKESTENHHSSALIEESKQCSPSADQKEQEDNASSIGEWVMCRQNKKTTGKQMNSHNYEQDFTTCSHRTWIVADNNRENGSVYGSNHKLKPRSQDFTNCSRFMLDTDNNREYGSVYGSNHKLKPRSQDFTNCSRFKLDTDKMEENGSVYGSNHKLNPRNQDFTNCSRFKLDTDKMKENGDLYGSSHKFKTRSQDFTNCNRFKLNTDRMEKNGYLYGSSHKFKPRSQDFTNCNRFKLNTDKMEENGYLYGSSHKLKPSSQDFTNCSGFRLDFDNKGENGSLSGTNHKSKPRNNKVVSASDSVSMVPYFNPSLYDANARKFMDMMKYTKYLGKVSASLSTKYDL